MPKVSPIQTSFGAGEFSPLLKGQVDLDRYKQALDTCENFIPTLQGGLFRRSGTKHISEVKTSSSKTRLLPFEFSTTQAYILEFGDEYIRFYRNHGQILEDDDVTIYEITSPYQEADLFQLRTTQSADVLYITHPSYQPRTLSRTGHNQWVLDTIEFKDGPYAPTNTSPYSITPSAATGSTTLTTTSAAISNAANNGSGAIRITTSGATGFSEKDRVAIVGVGGTTEANGNWNIVVIDGLNFDLVGSTFTNAYTAGGNVFYGLFESGDENGRLVRLREGSVWGYVRITAYTHGGLVTGTVINTLTNTSAKTFFRMGIWSDYNGYPATVAFHEDRLCFAGATKFPQRLDCSVTGEYENFAPSDTAGTVVATNALSFTFNANDVNVVRWLIPDEKGLLVGTAGGEWLVRPTSQGEALTPTNITAKRSTKYGSANVQAIQVGKSALFIQKAGLKLRELAYFFDADGFRATDLTLLAEHITESGIVELAPLKEPQPILWAVRNDGYLAALTYERDVDSFKVGWHRHIIGGQSDAGGTHAIVESAAVIPSPDGTRDDLWLVVKRWVDGAVARYIEYLTPQFDETIEQKDAFFVDSGLTYDAPITISGITVASPGVVTATAHGLNNGDKVLLSDILGLADPDSTATEPTSVLQDMSFLVANKTANTFELNTLDGDAYATTGLTPYVSGGEVRLYVSTISGLGHLEGETVDILGDGAVQPSKEVVGGEVDLDFPATTVHVGFGYRSAGKMLRLNVGAADGTAMGKTQRSQRVGVMMHRSLGLKVGMSFDDLTELTFRTAADNMSRAPALFTGILSETIEADYDFENQFCFVQDQPLPCMILAIMPQLITQDR